MLTIGSISLRVEMLSGTKHDKKNLFNNNYINYIHI